jgi:broad specificity phosphatase PhoE
MKKYLVLVKHSVPEIQESLPAHQWKLSADGRVRAERLADHLQRFQPAVIISSKEPKAIETAEIVARKYSLEPRATHDLHEHDRSNIPFLSQEQFQDSVREFFQRPTELVFGRETADQAHARFYRAVHSILNENMSKTVVIVAHGTVIALFVSRLTGSSDFELWKMLGLPSFIALDLDSSTLIVRGNID